MAHNVTPRFLNNNLLVLLLDNNNLLATNYTTTIKEHGITTIHHKNK